MSSGYLRTFTAQIDALRIAYQEILNQFSPHMWDWGGGTVLALYDFQHRRSFDVDIFIYEPQLFSFLSPKWILDNESSAFSHEYEESADHIQLLVEHSRIKVDFILSSPLFPELLRENERLDLDFPFYVESVEEIIAKKLKFRRAKNIARDIFDTALAIERQPELLEWLYQQRILSIEGLIEWDMALQKLDMKRYWDEIELISPQSEKLELAKEAPALLRQAIERLRQSILNAQ